MLFGLTRCCLALELIGLSCGFHVCGGADVVWYVDFKWVCVELGVNPMERSHGSTSGK